MSIIKDFEEAIVEAENDVNYEDNLNEKIAFIEGIFASLSISYDFEEQWDIVNRAYQRVQSTPVKDRLKKELSEIEKFMNGDYI